MVDQSTTGGKFGEETGPCLEELPLAFVGVRNGGCVAAGAACSVDRHGVYMLVAVDIEFGVAELAKHFSDVAQSLFSLHRRGRKSFLVRPDFSNCSTMVPS